MLLSELAEMLGLSIEGPNVDIAGVNTLESAGPKDLTFLANPKYAPQLDSTRAAAVIVSAEDSARVVELGKSALVSANVYLDLARISATFSRKQGCLEGVSESAFVHPEARLGDNVVIYPFVFVGPRTEIQSGTTIFPGCYIGEDCVIGRGCVLYPNVTLMAGTVLGHEATIQPGAVIGGDGFGYVSTAAGHAKIPQIGTVEIGNDVEIGANSTIDRAALDVTRIGAGTKVDNLVMLAHNVQVGRNCLIVSQVGVAGSTRIGDNVVLAGQAGLVNDLTIGDNVIVGAQAGVPSNLPDGFRGSGSPIMEAGTFRRAHALFRKLPELKKRISSLEKELEELKQQIAGGAENE